MPEPRSKRRSFSSLNRPCPRETIQLRPMNHIPTPSATPAMQANLLGQVSFSMRAESLLAGQVDFGTFSVPSSGAQFVEVNVPGNLIALAAKFVQKAEPDVAQLLNGLKLVHVNVIGMDDENRGELEKRVAKVRKELSGKGWERIVTAQQQDQDVGVYLKMDEKSAVQGLTVVVLEGKKQAVFVNVVGDIKPEQLAMLGEKLNIEPLKKLVPETEKKSEKAEN